MEQRCFALYELPQCAHITNPCGGVFPLRSLVCHKPQDTSFQNTSVYKGANK